MDTFDTDNFRVYKRFAISPSPLQLLTGEDIRTCAVCGIVVKGLGVIRFEGVDQCSLFGESGYIDFERFAQDWKRSLHFVARFSELPNTTL